MDIGRRKLGLGCVVSQKTEVRTAKSGSKIRNHEYAQEVKNQMNSETPF
jgi:hypothetical protein